jgi:hypothetical protein
MMMIDQFGKSFRIGLISDVQGCEPIELAGCCPRTSLGHFGDAEIDVVGENGGEQHNLILRRLTGLQMSEVLAKPRPAINLQEQVGDLDMREQSVCAAHQHARFFGYGIGQRRYLQAALADGCIRQLAACRQPVHFIERLFE